MSSKKYNSSKLKELPPVGSHHDGSCSVYMMHKIAKLRELQSSSSTESSSNAAQIFTHCIMFVNGVTNPPVEELRRLVGLHGGEVVSYRITELTHFVCDYLTDAQLKRELSKRKASKSQVFNVRAQWIVDSIQAHRRLDEMLYQPKELQGKLGQPINTIFSASTRIDNNSSQPVDPPKAPATPPVVYRSFTSGESSPFLDSPSLLGFTNSQEEFIRSIPMEEFQEEVFEQLIQHKLQQKRQRRESLSSNTRCTESTKRNGGGSVTRAPMSPVVMQQLQEIVNWIHSPDASSTATARRLSTYCRQLVLTLSGASSSGSSPLRGPPASLVEVLQLYALWLVQQDLLDMASLLLRVVRGACDELVRWSSTREHYLPHSEVTGGLDAVDDSFLAQWRHLVKEVDRFVQGQVKARFLAALY